MQTLTISLYNKIYAIIASQILHGKFILNVHFVFLLLGVENQKFKLCEFNEVNF